MSIDVPRPRCGIQRNINRPSGGFGRQPNVPYREAKHPRESGSEALPDSEHVCFNRNITKREAAFRSLPFFIFQITSPA